MIRIPEYETGYSALKALRFPKNRQLCFYAEGGELEFSRGTNILETGEIY